MFGYEGPSWGGRWGSRPQQEEATVSPSEMKEAKRALGAIGGEGWGERRRL